MPALVATALVNAAGVAAGSAAATAITVGAHASFLVAGVASARHQSRKLLRDTGATPIRPPITTRGSAASQVAIIGRTRVGGAQLAPGWTSGADNEAWTIPFGFASCDDTDTIWQAE